MELRTGGANLYIQVLRPDFDQIPGVIKLHPEQFALTLEECRRLLRWLPQSIKEMEDNASKQLQYEAQYLRDRLGKIESGEAIPSDTKEEEVAPAMVKNSSYEDEVIQKTREEIQRTK